ncbi:MAG TPA: molybdopterin cofactor-binding domain-containing protein [Gaiellaceae bacterium]|nr:molybdopterin cofactor-binding domain-containing protein [Gaiellaceae bacterium]
MQDVLPVLNPQLVGARVPRVEDPRLLTGRGRYIADISLPGMLHAAFVRSTFAHGKIRSVDTAEAKALPGVHAVWTGADVTPLTAGIPGGLQIEEMKATVQPAVASDYVRYIGEAVAVVVADSRHVAEDAAALIAVDVEPLPPVLDAEAAAAGGDVANEDIPDNLVLARDFAQGDADAAFASAAVTVSGRFRTGRTAAIPMETRGVIAQYEWTTQQLTVWSSTQIPHFFRSMIAAFIGMPEHAVEMIAPDVGGGFGQKCHLFPEELVIPLLARELGRPVKWIEDRVENLATGTHAKQQLNEMEIAFDDGGKIVGLRQHVVGDGGAYNCFPWTALVEPMAAAGTVTSVYHIENVKTRFAAVLTNKVPIGACRGIGWQAPQIARENLLDQGARKLGLSPFELRKRNVVKPEQFPYTAATGLRFAEGSYLESIEALEQAIDYEEFRARQKRERDQGRYLGLGISVFNEITGLGTIAAYATGFPVTSHDSSTVRMEPSGKVTVFTSLTSQGQGHQTTLAQIAADALGVALEDVVVRSGDSRQAYGLGTWGSRAAVIGSGSILRAAEPIRRKLLQTAGHLLEASEDDLVLANGRIEVQGSPDKGMAVGDVAGVIYFAAHVRPPGMDPTLESTAAYDPSEEVWANGAHAAIVEVDTETGLVSIERFVAVEDCGTMINPTIVEGQLRGGITQAIGAAFLEEMTYDEHGQLLTSTFMDYLIPTASEAPEVEIIHIETPAKTTAGGVKGMGESAMIAAPAALVNAVNDALEPFGAFLTDVPLTPDRVLSAIPPRSA